MDHSKGLLDSFRETDEKERHRHRITKGVRERERGREGEKENAQDRSSKVTSNRSIIFCYNWMTE